MVAIQKLRPQIVDFYKIHYFPFRKRFVEDWTKSKNVFSDPLKRCCAINEMINKFITINAKKRAINLFLLAEEKKAWNINIGFETEKIKKKEDMGHKCKNLHFQIIKEVLKILS